MWAEGYGINKRSLGGKVKRMGRSSGVRGLNMERKQPILIATQIYIYLKVEYPFGDWTTGTLFLSSPSVARILLCAQNKQSPVFSHTVSQVSLPFSSHILTGQFLQTWFIKRK